MSQAWQRLSGNENYADKAQFRTLLSQFIIVDFGTIMEINPQGFATVQVIEPYTNRIRQYTSVELLYIGNAGGAIVNSSAGSLCLLLCPRTPLVDTKTMMLSCTQPDYSEQCYKAIVLTNATQSVVQMLCTADGLAFQGQDYLVTFDQKQWSLKTKDGLTQIQIDNDGTVGVLLNAIHRFSSLTDGTIIQLHFVEQKPFLMDLILPDGTVKQFRNGTEDFTVDNYVDPQSYTTWLWQTIHNPDGSMSIQQNDNSGTEQLKIEIGTDGQTTLTQNAPVNLNIVGDTTVAIDGNANIATTGDTSVKADKSVTLEATGSDLLTIKNSIDSLGNILKTFMQNVASIDTVGSPASHTAGPGIIQAMTNLINQCGQVFS